MSVPVASLSISTAMCSAPPTPPLPALSLPGLALAQAISSGGVFAGTPGLTANTVHEVVTSATGVKSLIGS